MNVEVGEVDLRGKYTTVTFDCTFDDGSILSLEESVSSVPRGNRIDPIIEKAHAQLADRLSLIASELRRAVSNWGP